jgi:hypothetical protein
MKWRDASILVLGAMLYAPDATAADDAALPKAAVAGPALSINVASGRHPISDDIYGMNFADEALAAELRLPVRRRGGNSTTRYNWQNDTFNTAADYFFENIPESNANPAALPDGSAADRFVEQDRRTSTRTIMTIPLIGWVAKRRLANHPYDCGFKVSKYGAQQSTDPFDTDCGNGIRTNASTITGNDPTDTSVAVGPSFVTSWINHLTGKYGLASNGGVAYYSLDNEPSLWNSTHRDVHPQPLTYDEIGDRGFQYGAAIKAADPSARTLGPVEWGWCGYFYSAADPGGCSIGTDYQAHANTPFVAWYLQQMSAYQQQHGVRILDYLDLHFYPQASGVALSPAGSAATQALRLRTTRSLWDPAYIDESWISDLAPGGIAVRMIPRMKDWVSANYPGTRLAITEYNFGGLESVNGALTQADVLGIFGREGLDLATIWDPPASGQPGAFAFRMYRNYDGAGHGFGETSMAATSADATSLSVFAAQRAADNALTVMAINKSGSDLTSSVTLAGFNPVSPASVYRYSGAAPGAIQRLADQAVTASGFSATFPANSITLFVILPAITLDPALDADGDGIPNGVEIAEGRNPLVKDNDVFGNARLFSMQQYRDFLSREGDPAGITGWTDLITGGAYSRLQVIDAFLSSAEFSGFVAPVVRLYFATFLRVPDYEGLAFNAGLVKNGTITLTQLADFFTASPEFAATYGSLNNTQFVTLLYNNVLGRAPDAAGLNGWVSLLTSGYTRGQVLLGFSDSVEYQAAMANKVFVTMMYAGMLRRTPEPTGFNGWVGFLDTAALTREQVINGFFASTEYHNRFLP